MTGIGRLDYVAHRLGLIWLIVFSYTIAAGLLIQFILLPYVFPAWHWGAGLFKGMDGPQFHTIALELSQRIEAQGWQAWEPRPDGQFVSGIAAIWYVLIYPAPWSVLAFNAVLNATGVVCIILMLDNILHERRRSVLAALPFAFFPSALLWNAQFHNENYAVPGVAMLLCGLSYLAGNQALISARLRFAPLILVGVGSLLLGAVRGDILHGMFGLCASLCAALICLSCIGFSRTQATLSSLLQRIAYLSLVIPVMAAATAVTYYPWRVALAEGVNPLILDIWQPETDAESATPSGNSWDRTPWLPVILDDQLKELAKTHNAFIRAWADSGSGIDLDVRFENAADVIAYVPRALQIALFSPFPNMWFTQGQKLTGTAMRAASAFEMLIAYFCLLGLPYIAWKNRRQPAMWVVMIVCTVMLLVYAISIPNYGSLYRFRYPYYMPLICLGLAGSLQAGNSAREIAGHLVKTGGRRAAQPDPSDGAP